ncbi:MAG TPA: hypothetical protein VMO26_03730 [Vicinamibacterales bacterium]|nr:hypothetical protein [Vicinamibacterales bacterium]
MRRDVRCFWSRIRNESAEALTSYAGFLLIPLGQFGRELIAKRLEPPKALFDGREMLVPEREHLRTRHSARTRQREDLGDFLEGEAQRLRLLDEAQLHDRLLRVPSVP